MYFWRLLYWRLSNKVLSSLRWWWWSTSRFRSWWSRFILRRLLCCLNLRKFRLNRYLNRFLWHFGQFRVFLVEHLTLVPRFTFCILYSQVKIVTNSVLIRKSVVLRETLCVDGLVVLQNRPKTRIEHGLRILIFLFFLPFFMCRKTSIVIFE